MVSWLTVVVLVAATALGVLALVYALTRRTVDDRLLIVLGALEIALIAQVVVGLAQGVGRTTEFEKAVFFAYLLTVPFIAPGRRVPRSQGEDAVVDARGPRIRGGRRRPRRAPRPDLERRCLRRHPEKGSTRRGLGIILVALYGLFALAATGRATYQIIADFQKAPVAYLLSALAAVIYLVATVALARGDRTSIRVARVAITIELIGVLTVGLVSYLVPSEFPDKTVWSHFGSGYGYFPLILPILGLLWLRYQSRR